MKALIYATLFISLQAHADISNCLKDARSSGNHLHAINAPKECASVIKSHKDKVEAKAGNIHAYGVDHMLYIENTDGSLELQAGDQTELKKIQKIQIYPEQNRMLVLQPGSVASYRLNFIGNVTPLYHNKHQLIEGAAQAKLHADELLIAHPESSAVIGFNADGDSRKIGKSKPEIKRSLTGSRTQLHHPIDLEVLPKLKLLVVLDEDRLLVFPLNANGNAQPLKILHTGLEGATSLKLEGDIFSVQSQDKQHKVSLDQLK